MRYNSKRDWFYTILYALNFVLCGVIVFALLQSFDVLSVLLSILLIAELIIISIMFFNCYYEIDSDKIKMVIGFVSLDIKIKDINKITKCNNYVFSFALAGNRIEIAFGKNRLKRRNKFYISPKDGDLFIKEICAHKDFKGVVDESF